MYHGIVMNMKTDSTGMQVLVHLDDANAAIKRQQDIRMYPDDGRIISEQQRKKIYATINDISDYTGYLPEEAKEKMKYYHIERTGEEYFSLSDCSMETARQFINTLIEFCLLYGVPVYEPMLSRTDDIDTYLYQCLKYRKCCICGKQGEIHHWDAVGMGNDRRKYDDTNNRKMCLCRLHHTIAHQKGVIDFQRDYHVYGIIYNEKQVNTNGL